MKRVLMIVLLMGLLCGCSEQPVSVPEDITENTTDTETQTEPVPTVTETSVPETAAPTEPVSKLTYTIGENSIRLKMNGKPAQELELGYTLSSFQDDYISIADFDFDGYQDIFIPADNTYREGSYYRYNPETEQFEDWEQLNAIGNVMEPEEENILVMKMYAQTGEKFIWYEWKDGEILPFCLRDYYYTSNGTTEDIYEYTPDGSKILIERILRDEKNKVYQTYSRDELIYFSVHENGIDVLRDGEILQTIAGNFYEELDKAALLKRREIPYPEPEYHEEWVFYTPEDFLNTSDFDFDSYPDLFIPTNHLGSEGIYYRFDPENNQFVEWDALNEIGLLLYTDGNTLDRYSTKDRTHYIYQWENDDLVCISQEAY